MHEWGCGAQFAVMGSTPVKNVHLPDCKSEVPKHASS